MSQPFDLDAVVLEAEDAKPFRFTWGGKTFEFPPFVSMPIDRQIFIIEAIAGTGKDEVDVATLVDVLKSLLGDDLIAQLAATKGANGKPFTFMRLMPLIIAWVNDQGGDMGKSPASSPSSASTAPRSKPTSRSGRARKTS